MKDKWTAIDYSKCRACCRVCGKAVTPPTCSTPLSSSQWPMTSIGIFQRIVWAFISCFCLIVIITSIIYLFVFEMLSGAEIWNIQLPLDRTSLGKNVFFLYFLEGMAATRIINKQTTVSTPNVDARAQLIEK